MEVQGGHQVQKRASLKAPQEVTRALNREAEARALSAPVPCCLVHLLYSHPEKC